MEPIAVTPSRRAGHVAFVAGCGSALLLVASLLWAHHWSPQTVTLVGAWGSAMLATPVASALALRRGSAPALAKWGLALNLLTWLALILGVIAAVEFGANVASCGGA